MIFMTKRYLFLIVWVIACGSVVAQKLHRKGTFGITYEEASADLMTSLRILETRGIVVKTVQPNSTAESLGILANDVLVSINEVDSLFIYDYVQTTNRLYENDPISVTFVRNKRKNRVVGVVKPALKEMSPTGEVSYDEVPYLRGHLRSIVHKPTGTGRFPAIFYLQDYDCNSIDFSSNTSHPVKQLIDGWVKAGYVVYRIEKPGVGESENTKDCTRLTFLEELRAFERGLSVLKKYNYVDSSRVFLFGHALGGAAAPLMAARATTKPRGIMTYGTVVKPWFEHMIDVFRKQPLLFKESNQSIEANVRMLTPLLYDWIIAHKSPNDLLQEPDYEAILTSKENPLKYEKGNFFGRSPVYFQELNQQNLYQAWAQSGVATLAIHGETDIQSISDEAAKTIVNIVNEVKPNRGTFKLLRNTERNFVKVPSLEEYKNLLDTNRFTEFSNQNFNHEVIEITTEWMKKQ
jgi:uncharacterized protein